MSLYKHGLAIFVLAFSMSAVAVGDLIDCTGLDSMEEYNQWHSYMKSDPNDVFTRYVVAIVSLCVGKKAEGISHLQATSDSGYIPATYLLSIYYEYNQTFNSFESPTHTLEDLNAALYYYEKTTEMIQATPDYPSNTLDGTSDVEYYLLISYRSFASIPGLYFNGYNRAIEDVLNSAELVSYTDTLEVLLKMQTVAKQCVDRPSLSAWWDREAEVFNFQQIRCTAYLNYANAVLPLEEKRINTAQTCTTSLSECPEHREILNQIEKEEKEMEAQIRQIPKQYLLPNQYNN